MQPLLVQLDQDHGNVSRLLDILERQRALLHRGGEVDVNLAGRILLYMTRYQDVFHHPREDLLFSRLVKSAQGTSATVEQLEDEHRRLSSMGTALYGAFSRGFGDDDGDEVAGQLDRYVNLLRDHMALEGKQIFPIAQAALETADWEFVDEQLQAGPDPVFRRDVEKGYQVVIEALAKG